MRNKINLLTEHPVILATISGSLLALSRLPWNLGFLVFFSFIPLFILFQSEHKYPKIIWSALAFSSSYTVISLHWISLVTVAGFFGLFLLFGFYFIIFFSAVNLVQIYAKRYTSLAIITFWMAFEYLQNFGELRFPWFNIGYSLEAYNALIQVADLGGVFLVSLLTLICNFFIFKYLYKSQKSLIPFVMIFGTWLSYGIYCQNNIQINSTDKIVSMVQASIPQDYKWDPEFADSTMAIYNNLTAEAAEINPELIIWPESALPDYLMQRNSKFRQFLNQQLLEHKIDIFTGVPRYEFAPPEHPLRYKFYNSATLFHPDLTFEDPYDKKILVPIGERMPFMSLIPALWNLELGQANFSYGKTPAHFTMEKYQYSPLICFEVAFPALTLKIMEQPTDFVVNITNDAWFKRSIGTYQHAIMTKFRAIEIRRSFYRCANSGYSLVINPLGKTIIQTELFEKRSISYPLFSCSKISFFTKYFALIPLVCSLITLFICVMVILGRMKK